MRSPADPPRDNPPAGTARSGLDTHLLIVIALGVASLVVAWVTMTAISRTDPWYRNTDMNVHNMVDALSINSDVSPHQIDQPGLPMKYLLALDYRVQHYLGALPVWNLKKLDQSKEPLQEIPALIRLGRTYSRVLVIGFILLAAWLAFVALRTIESVCLTVVLLCSSTGLLFHGQLVRPELLCALFGNILALFCTWEATSSRHWARNVVWLFLAGIFGGLAALNKMPGSSYLAVGYVWCWLSALTTTSATVVPAAAQSKADLLGGLLALAGGLAALGLLEHLATYAEPMSWEAILRLRLFSVGVGVAPLLPLCCGRNHARWTFLFNRWREFIVIGGGAVASLPLSFLAVRMVMREPGASQYVAGVVNTLLYPEAFLRNMLGTKPDTMHEIMLFFRETPVLFVFGILAPFGLFFCRPVPLRLKAFIALLPLVAVGFAVLMSRRYYTAQYSIFVQVPLLLALAFSLSAFWAFPYRPPGRKERHWTIPAVLTAAFVVMLGTYPPLHRKYVRFQDDAGLPVNHFTITFLYDHNAHPARYLQIMRAHYGDRAHFTEILGRYLADPANRY